MANVAQNFESPSKNEGPYDLLYVSSANNILWGNKFTHMLEKYINDSHSGKVLDLGCGDGVNSFALEKAGFYVSGIDISKVALNGLKNRFRLSSLQQKGTYFNCSIFDIRKLPLKHSYDLVVSCGLFHCLPIGQRHEIHRMAFDYLKINGSVVFSALIDEEPMPEWHATSCMRLASKREVLNLFSGFSIQYVRISNISDAHPPLVPQHSHTVMWVIAQKNV